MHLETDYLCDLTAFLSTLTVPFSCLYFLSVGRFGFLNDPSAFNIIPCCYGGHSGRGLSSLSVSSLDKPSHYQ